MFEFSSKKKKNFSNLMKKKNFAQKVFRWKAKVDRSVEVGGGAKVPEGSDDDTAAKYLKISE